MIAGDAGVGKSRLLYEFLRGLDTSPSLELETTCASYGQAMAYRPIMEVYRRYLDLSEGLAADEIRRRGVERLRSLGIEGEEPALLLAHFLGASAPPEFLLRVQGAQLKARTNDVLASMLLRESERTPVVLVIENVHWIDASSEEFLKSLADRLHDHRALLVLTTRPGRPMEWLPATTETITLEGLDLDDLRQMVHTEGDLVGVGPAQFRSSTKNAPRSPRSRPTANCRHMAVENPMRYGWTFSLARPVRSMEGCDMKNLPTSPLRLAATSAWRRPSSDRCRPGARPGSTEPVVGVCA